MESSDSRNVNERYKWWDVEAIVEELDKTRSPLVFGFINVNGDFNKATGIRSLNFFNGREVWIIGRKKWDPRGAVGAHHYLKVNHTENFYTLCYDLRNEGYRIVAIEQDDRAVPMHTYDWPDKTFALFGEEGDGLSKEVLDLADDIVYVPGGGSVRSLNVGVTSGLVSYDYSVKRGYIK